MKKEDWVWMPHPGHLIVARDCRFHLNTYVGGYVVSTVGEYLPDSAVREILAESRGITLTGRGDERLASWIDLCGFEDVGAGRKYETMVFHAEPRDEPSCCPCSMSDSEELDTRAYNEPRQAVTGHMEMCEKWSAAEPGYRKEYP